MTENTTIILHGERPISWNKFYSGNHWTVRREEADRVHMLMRAAIDPTADQYRSPVHIHIIVYFDRRPMDADNIAAKLYIDGLKPWLIRDDTPECVRSVTTSSRIDKVAPRIEIHIEAIND